MNLDFSIPDGLYTRAAGIEAIKRLFTDAGAAVIERHSPFGSFMGIPLARSPMIPADEAWLIEGGELTARIKLPEGGP